MSEYHVVSFSGGKDSTSMLLRMLELGMQVDEILFCDTGVEFPQMYEHIDKVEKYIGRKITRLKANKSYEYYLLEHQYVPKFKESMNINHDPGYSWPSPRNRWCTRAMKVDCLKAHLRSKKDFSIKHYVGIAADEPRRIKDREYPLFEWGWPEKKCLAYCRSKGFDWGGLYDIFTRVSCWCCPLQSLQELRRLRHKFPELWDKLRGWDGKTWRKFRVDYSVEELELRFAKEDEIERMQMKLF